MNLHGRPNHDRRRAPLEGRARAWCGMGMGMGVGMGVALAMAAALAGCATPPVAQGGLADLLERPAERSLVEGIRAYDDGQYAQAETALRKALTEGLRSARDQASAHKLLAFIACTSDRAAVCEEAFRAARAADPAFALNRSEAGHPLWGPVYRRLYP